MTAQPYITVPLKFPHHLRDISRELIVDSFCGGGGTSLGLSWWTGTAPHIAINHNWPAIEMHRSNHPTTLHYREDIFGVDPRRAIGDRGVAFFWASPDCRHFSLAAGGIPKSKAIRGLSWSVLAWASLPIHQRPRSIGLENVPEILTWGPLLPSGKPDPKRKGETWKAFVLALTTGLPSEHPAFSEIEEYLGSAFDRASLERGLGYTLDTKLLRACDYGTPTRRRRLFMIARCDGKPLEWPKPTHGPRDSEDVKEGKLLPYPTAAKDVIDWSVAGTSIFERTKKTIGGRHSNDSPLAHATNTLSRIAKGYVRLVESKPEPWIVRIGQTGFTLAESASHSIHDPLTTVVSKAEHCLCIPTLVHLKGTSKEGFSANDLVPSVMSGGQHIGLSQAIVVKFFGTSTAFGCTEPVHTVTAKDRFGLAEFSHAKELTDEERLAAWHVARFIDVYGREPSRRPELAYLDEPRSSYIGAGNAIVVDILFRMFTPRELYRAQGFPDNYIIDVGPTGKPISKADQIARCGNAVPPQLSYAVISSLFPDEHMLWRRSAA